MSSNSQSKSLYWGMGLAVTGLALVILGSTIFMGTMELREKIRHQIVQRDAAILHEIALWQQLTLGKKVDPDLGLDHLSGQLTVALEISQLKGVIAARLYDAQGGFVISFPPTVAPATLLAEDYQALKSLQPLSRFRARARLVDTFEVPPQRLSDEDSEADLLDVWVPLSEADPPELKGIVQFVMDGQMIAREFEVLDRSLTMQASLAFVAAGLLMSMIIGWAFRRLAQTNRQLVHRTMDLKRANEELALAAKSSALGAVTAHLLHGLSNPLSGLQDYIKQQARPDRTTGQEEWQHAVESTGRMRKLVDEAVRVLGEEEHTEHYEVTIEEVANLIRKKSEPLAQNHQVKVQTRIEGQTSLDNRVANLVMLILENLVQNAIQAGPKGSEITLNLVVQAPQIRCEVTDQGPGIPQSIQATLFKPCRSAKPGGSGIGLAICKQLANHLGATLNLQHTSPQGTTFAFTFPMSHTNVTPTVLMEGTLK